MDNGDTLWWDINSEQSLGVQNTVATHKTIEGHEGTQLEGRPRPSLFSGVNYLECKAASSVLRIISLGVIFNEFQ